ncbi:hypothetical protein [Mycobacterium sp. E2479]|uniref:hypothetical protein n=1 Tax=Mycobacterium sp. E2479 TaxID=1834134 RepID=UPI0007FED900|nr:hypothetical protein [Mycobacterium sp. E2479]OBH54323.1 hypothetical protein A5686_08220 [Mycobacterium sp. E2479]
MPKTIDETLLPRPPQLLDLPALAPATRRAADRLQEQFNLSPEAAEAFAGAVVDPAEIRKAADNPEALYVPGGTLFGLRTRVWTRRVMPDPRNPRIGPARRHPIAVAPGSTEEAHFRPIPEPDPDPDRRPELRLALESREHLAWASVIAKKFILKDNDWRLSIRHQGVMSEVWLSAVTLMHGDRTAPVTVPVTSEGSSRVVACHDILDLRSADVPYTRDDRALRSIVRSLNEALTNGPTVEQAEALRCETIPALLLVGFEPHPNSTTTFATAVRSLVALRHVEPPKPWNEAAKMGSIADAVLEALTDQGLLRSDEELWLLGELTPKEAEARGFSADPAVRAARIVRLLTDTDPLVYQTIRVAITGQTTKQRITNKFRLEVAAALILRAVSTADEGHKVSDIYRAFQAGFADVLASEPWQATYRPTEEVLESALRELERGASNGAASLELAARAAYPLIVSRQLFPDRGTKNNDQIDRRHPGTVIDRMRTNEWGMRQLGQALIDYAHDRRIRAVSPTGKPISLDNGDDQLVTDNWLRQTFPPPGRPVAPAAPETAHERYLDALSKFGEAMDGVDRAVRRLLAVEGIDGRALIETEGVDPANADAWMEDVMKLVQLIPVWRNTHISRHGMAPSPTTAWRDDGYDAEDADNGNENEPDDES